MTEKQKLFNLPEEPVDGYRIDWWRVSTSRDWYYINKMHAIYYVNTPWNEYAPENKGGAALVDDWMIYKDDYKWGEGRWCGWKTPEENLAKYHIGYATREEAEEATKRYLEEYKQKAERDIQIINAMLVSLEKGRLSG